MELLSLIKQAAVEACEQTKPSSIMLGTVTNTEPLSVKISQKLELSATQLILSRNVTDYDVEMTVEHFTEDYKRIIDTSHNHGETNFNEQSEHTHIGADGAETEPTALNTAHSHDTAGDKYDLTHSHEYKGRKVFRVHNALKTGEKVILIRENGGQRFYIIDRIYTNEV